MDTEALAAVSQSRSVEVRLELKDSRCVLETVAGFKPKHAVHTAAQQSMMGAEPLCL